MSAYYTQKQNYVVRGKNTMADISNKLLKNYRLEFEELLASESYVHLPSPLCSVGLTAKHDHIELECWSHVRGWC